MAITLFTIGDSISQGFMSGAAARTDLSFSTIISKIIEAENYNYPNWSKGGLPFNLELLFRKLENKLGKNISGPIEWTRAIVIINNYLDEVEDYYERGAGSLENSISPLPYHNVSIRGFDISNSWQLKPSQCQSIIKESEKNGDNFFATANESLLRTTYKVLASNPEPLENDFSQLDWLNFHHQKEGVKNVFLWLGANNALGTVVDLKIKPTSLDGSAFTNGSDKVSYKERIANDWNLWHPEDFRIEYQFMMDNMIASKTLVKIHSSEG